jgi:hypothetical protein
MEYFTLIIKTINHLNMVTYIWEITFLSSRNEIKLRLTFISLKYTRTFSKIIK